jgi:putative SOS response-associated peptidase YedK
MCGRFVSYKAPSVYATLLEVESVPVRPNYNIAPSQDVAATRQAIAALVPQGGCC